MYCLLYAYHLSTAKHRNHNRVRRTETGGREEEVSQSVSGGRSVQKNFSVRVTRIYNTTDNTAPSFQNYVLLFRVCPTWMRRKWRRILKKQLFSFIRSPTWVIYEEQVQSVQYLKHTLNTNFDWRRCWWLSAVCVPWIVAVVLWFKIKLPAFSSIILVFIILLLH